MKKLKLILQISFLSVLMLLISNAVSAQIAAGTYTVGADAEDAWETIQEAVDTLVNQGLAGDGHVTINIDDGIYYEQITINEIANTSADNTVTFQSASADSSKVSIMHATTESTNNYVLYLNGCNYVTFKKIRIYNYGSDSYSRVIVLGNSKYITITNCDIIGNAVTNTTSDYSALIYGYSVEVDTLTINQCNLQDGSWAVSLNGAGKVSEGLVFSDNVISSLGGIGLNDMDRVTITNNTIATSYAEGIYLYECDFNTKITSNIINVNSTRSANLSGIIIDHSNGNVVYQGLIANNSISMSAHNSYNSSPLAFDYSSNYKVYNNSCNLISAKNNTGVLWAGNSSKIELLNNNFVNSCAGYAISLASSDNISLSDYNNLYTGGNFLVNWGENVFDLEALQALPEGQDDNSTSYFPSFVSSTDLRVQTHWLNGTGSINALGDVPDDINGTTRDATKPDIGAFEFVPDNTSSYNGTYSIAVTGGDFASLNEAIDSLEVQGVSGPVSLKFADGTYSERVYIHEIPGASAANRITITSASADSSKVNFIYNTTTDIDISAIILDGADYITFSHLTLGNSSTTSKGRVFNFKGYAHHNIVENNILSGSGSAYDTNDRTTIYSSGSLANYLLIQNNKFLGGSHHVSLYGIDANPDVLIDGLTIKNNIFNTASVNVNLWRVENVLVEGNQMNDFTYAAVQVKTSENPIHIKNNKIYSSISDDQAIRLEGCYGTLGGVINNNFVSVENGYSVVGIVIYLSQYINVYFNSVNVIGNNGDNQAIHVRENNTVVLKNNNLVVAGNGYAVYSYDVPTTLTSDYNNLYSGGANLVYWGSEYYASLSDYQTATSQGTNSVNVNPGYISETDLHTNSYWLDDAGTAISGIAIDIDGDDRSDPPCIGADEYTTTLSPLAGTYEIGTGGDYTTISAAVDALAENGLSGNVVFKIISGNYNEQFVIPQISIINDSDSIIFESKSGNATDVKINYEGTLAENNYIVKLEGADRITFRDLSFLAGDSEFSQCIAMTGNVNRIYIKNCEFFGRTTASIITNDAIIYAAENEPYLNTIVIDSNIFTNGSWNIYLYGDYYNQNKGIMIRNNVMTSTFKNIYVRHSESPAVIQNQMTFSGVDGYGIYMGACVSNSIIPTQVIKNEVYGNQKTNMAGIYLYDTDGLGSQPVILANNVVQVGAMGQYESYGIRIYNTDNANIYYNSVNLIGNYTADRAFYSQNCDNINIYNNSFAIQGNLRSAMQGAGYSIDIESGTNVTGNNNNFYTPGRVLGEWMNTRYKSLSEYKAASGQFTNSISVFPSYISMENLETKSSFLNGAAKAYAGISDDINGVTRDATTPDIGAYEILTPDSPLVGSYTVGAGGNFATIDSMCISLMRNGIDGSVTFNIVDGTYSDVNYMFKDIPGTGSNDTVVIQSQSLDSTKVTLSFEQTEAKNYIFYLNGTDYLTIKHLTLASAGGAYSSILRMYGYSHSIHIHNNILNGVSTTTYNTDQISILAHGDAIIDSIDISRNVFNYNSYAIRIDGYPSYTNKYISISDNVLNDQYYGVYLYEVNSPKVYYNKIVNSMGRAIYFDHCPDYVEAVGNDIYTNSGAYGIHLYYSEATSVNTSLIANNFIRTNGNYGIDIYQSDYVNIYNNTVSHVGTSSGACLYIYYGENLNVKNNIFNVENSGYTLHVSSGSSILESDYNNFFSQGSRFINYDYTAYDTLPDFQAALSLDINSYELEPVFLAENDLHLLSFDLMEKATPLAEVTHDVDKELRDLLKPDIGADEMYARPPLAESHTICEGEPTPTLSALGINVKWYDDEELTNLVWSANDFNPGVAASGIYTYYVTQTIGDDASDPTIVTLTIIASPVIEGVVVNIDCQGNDYGGVNLTVTSDNGPFFYRWSNEATTEDITNLLSGKYFVTVEDIIGCTSKDSFEITAPNPIVLTMIVNDADCGETNGSATVFAEGGNEPYTYSWTSGDSVAVTTNLASGIYMVTVTDNNGCDETAIANVNDLGGSIIDIDAVNDVSCYGGSDGSIAITISGGVTPYETKWSNGESNQDINNLVAGPYEVTITDADTCKSVQSIKVNQPDPIFIGLGVFDSNCGQANGTAVTSVTGGVSPYIYDWSTGANESEIANLGLGVYGVTITDDNECEAEKSFAVSEAGAPVVYVDSIIEGTCGDNNGAIYITAYGGVGVDYNYLWSTNATDEDLLGLNPGEYSVTVSDSVGCSGATVAEIVAEKPATPSICIVSVDTATNHNEIVWTKAISTDIDYYNIYKESTQKDVYLLVDKVFYTDESIYVDSYSNAIVKSDRYKISAVNSCGVESDLSEHHKTMHLTIVPGNTSTSKVLRWDHYEGFYISTYYIYRQIQEADWLIYDSIQSSLTSYTDINVPVGDVTYFIEIKHPSGCDITKAGNRNSSRSNTKSTTNDPSISDKAEIVKFTLAEQVSGAAINTDKATVSLVVVSGTNLTALVPTIEVSTDASINPKTGVAMDFSNPVVYKVTAASGFSKDWTVTVIDEGSALFDVTFNVSSSTGTTGGAEVSFGGSVQSTNAEGITVFVDQAIGTNLPYTVAKSGFNDYSGTLDIVNADVIENVLLSPTGIENSIRNSLLVYPNPNKGSFYLYYEASERQSLSYSIYNKQGSKIMTKQILTSVGKVYDEINLKDVAKGVYFIQIVTDEFITHKKIIIK